MNDEIEIGRYTCHCFSSRERNDVVLFLYDTRSTVVAEVFAVPEGEPLPPAKRVDGRALLYFRRTTMPQIVDLLRNEAPVYLCWNNGGDAELATGYEPVGEGERVHA
jgi:hypothetical protein